MKKLVSLILAIMMIAAVGAAGASSVTIGSGSPSAAGDGEIGGYVTADTTNVDAKTVNLKKEITAYNLDESYVYGPDITYTFTVTPGSAGVSITDATTDHNPAASVTTSTLAGITTGVKVNNGTAGSNTSASGTLAWSNTDILEASTGGTANYKNLPLNFTDVIFTQPGVYRYKITEDSSTYAASGVTETTGSNDRYLDVYVMRSDDYGKDASGNASDTNRAGWWKIYGYVCVYDNTKAIVDGDTNHAVKTNGFVSGTSDGSTSFFADRYFTYNVTLTKDVQNDGTMVSHPFPFTVAFSNTTATGNFQLIAEKTGSATTITTTAETATTTVNGNAISGTILKVGTSSTLATSVAGAQTGTSAGVPKVADENATAGETTGSVKYIGIPAGTQVTVYETNDVVGTAYQYTHKVDTADASAAQTVYYNANTSSNLATLTATTVGSDDDVAHKIAFTNKLAQISPTGYVSRFAPYALILIGGIALLIIAKKRKPAKDEEE